MMVQAFTCGRLCWPQITDVQREQDRQIRLAQAEARRQMDEALRVGGRLWSSGRPRAAMEERYS